jgi:hypothetical protein
VLLYLLVASCANNKFERTEVASKAKNSIVPSKNSERLEKSGVLGRAVVVSPACLSMRVSSSPFSGPRIGLGYLRTSDAVVCRQVSGSCSGASNGNVNRLSISSVRRDTVESDERPQEGLIRQPGAMRLQNASIGKNVNHSRRNDSSIVRQGRNFSS